MNISLAPAYAYKSATAEKVVPIMFPFLQEAKKAGVSLMVEATPSPVGRRADIVEKVAVASGPPVIMATSFYREPWVGKETISPGLSALSDIMVQEFEEGIQGTHVKAAFIKAGATEDNITYHETQLLRAACQASLKTGAIICSHITGDKAALQSAEICEAEGLPLNRFAWFHANKAHEYQTLYSLGKKGVYLSLDYGKETAELLLHLRTDGLWNKILVSMDSGWYNPRGGVIHGYTDMFKNLFPTLQSKGVSQEELYVLAHQNVFDAYAR